RGLSACVLLAWRICSLSPRGRGLGRGARLLIEALPVLQAKKAAPGQPSFIAVIAVTDFFSVAGRASDGRYTAGVGGRSSARWRSFPSSGKSSRQSAPGRR